MIEKLKYDKVARREFLALNRSVIKQWVMDVVGHNVVYGFSDELSVGIVAFNEAIDKYNGKGNFYNYAKSFVKQRLFEISCAPVAKATKKNCKNI